VDAVQFPDIGVEDGSLFRSFFEIGGEVLGGDGGVLPLALGVPSQSECK